MLRTVLADYLGKLEGKEREFDMPLLALLSAMGYYDIHYTHGRVEFGKDFIAKRIFDGVETQFSFQLKAGNINQSTWRNDIMGQMLEAIMVGLSHPNFDRNVPHQAVLVTTGELVGNASVSFQEFNLQIEQVYIKNPVIFWDKENLLDYLESFGLDSVRRATVQGFQFVGNFYSIYSKSLKGVISNREIEIYSRQWLAEIQNHENGILVSVIEAETIAVQCLSHSLYYEAFFVYLGIQRAVLLKLQNAEEANVRKYLEIHYRLIEKIKNLLKMFLNEVQTNWENVGNDLSRMIEGPGTIITYLVFCSRIIECIGYLYFLDDSEETRNQLIMFLREFIESEPGSYHISSDWYAVSIVFSVIALINHNEISLAKEYLEKVVIWLCDRYTEGFGLASYGSEYINEVRILLGYPFEFIDIEPEKGSFLATVLGDLVAFLGDAKFYNDVVNDLKASHIFPEYWQVPDSDSLYKIEGEDIISYPNIEFNEAHSNFGDFVHAEHILYEPRDFMILGVVKPVDLMSQMLLMRDRYFPTIWPRLS